MRVTRRHAAVAAGTVVLAVAAGAGAATIAGGQSGTGPPTGTLSFKVRVDLKPSRNGINPATPRDKKRPKVADLNANNADLLSMDGRKIGLGHDFDVTTYEGAKKYKGKALFLGNTLLDFGGGNFLFEQCVREDSPTNNTCAIIGGTGIYAGARGVGIEDTNHGVEDRKAKTFTFPVTITFLT